MDFATITFWLFPLLLAAPVVLAGRKFGIARAFSALGIILIATGAAGLAIPSIGVPKLIYALCLFLIVWAGWIQFFPNSWAVFMDALMGGSLTSMLVIALYSTVVPFGNAEILVRYATDMGLIEYHKPMRTRLMYGIEDWREHAVTNDNLRIQDPVLLWRPNPGQPPYNAQGFKTDIIMEVPKPANVYRIMAYGDSNTDGSLTLDWSSALQELLSPRNTPQRKYEVINAGVSGYSSYQGMQRFLQEVDKYEPDLVFVSFGWNDLAHALNMPDKHYQPKSNAQVSLLRTLIKYRSYQTIQHYVQAPMLEAQVKKDIQPRVSLEDYLQNMQTFAQTAQEKGIEVVFLSRPYKYATEEILKNDGWRARVPSYNEALKQFSQERGSYFFDVQHHYEFNTEGLFSDESHFYTREGMAEMGRFLLHELEMNNLL
jgi:lysophospholipase L1-like esterase